MKKALSLFLSVLMILSVVPIFNVSGFAADNENEVTLFSRGQEPSTEGYGLLPVYEKNGEQYLDEECTVKWDGERFSRAIPYNASICPHTAIYANQPDDEELIEFASTVMIYQFEVSLLETIDNPFVAVWNIINKLVNSEIEECEKIIEETREWCDESPVQKYSSLIDRLRELGVNDDIGWVDKVDQAAVKEVGLELIAQIIDDCDFTEELSLLLKEFFSDDENVDFLFDFIGELGCIDFEKIKEIIPYALQLLKSAEDLIKRKKDQCGYYVGDIYYDYSDRDYYLSVIDYIEKYYALCSAYDIRFELNNSNGIVHSFAELKDEVNKSYRDINDLRPELLDELKTMVACLRPAVNKEVEEYRWIINYYRIILDYYMYLRESKLYMTSAPTCGKAAPGCNFTVCNACLSLIAFEDDGENKEILGVYPAAEYFKSETEVYNSLTDYLLSSLIPEYSETHPDFLSFMDLEDISEFEALPGIISASLDKICEDFHDELELDGLILPATGKHKFIDDVCSVCGALKEDSSECLHENTTTVTVPATCKAAGYTIVKCDDCEEEISNVILEKLTTHTWNNGEITKAATCKDTGVMTYTCTVCGATKTDTIAKLTTHTPGNAVKENEKAPTCTVSGAYDNVIYCTVCGVKLSSDTVTVNATGHKYVEFDKYDPDCDNEGYVISRCSVCGNEKTEIIDKLGHKDSDGDNNCDRCGKDMKEVAANCNHLCHKRGFLGFIWKIVRFFIKLFRVNQYCTCGTKHW